LHRGLTACLVFTHQPNSILIFGGNFGDHDLTTGIRVNLREETYVWETTLPEPMSNIKSVKDATKLLLLSNSNNIIYQYDLENRTWKNLSLGYKSYLPINDIKKFTCVTEPLKLSVINKKDI
jgi:hypothetical protein